MVFSEPIFLYLFFPIAILAISLSRGIVHSALILTFSLSFYYWSSGFIAGLLLASVLFNWGAAFFVRNKNRTNLWIFISLNLAALFYFKYAIFFSAQVDGLFGTEMSWTFRNVLLPVGISFFTFQAISYLVDVYRNDVAPERNPIIFGAYLTFFPQLIAGPIVRFKDAIKYYRRPERSIDGAAAGASRFVLGLLKKVVVADTAGRVADACFALSGSDQTFMTAWIGALAYTLQIYFDFSAYSDMAIGLGLMFGIKFNENFARPYYASTITEFWRRWHISLSTWFRDYLYIPLGGNRGGMILTYRNLLLVFLATGLWHGAAWTFVLWGLFHGAFLIGERIILKGSAGQMSSPWLRALYAMPVVIVGWVLFRAESLSLASSMVSNMVQFWEWGVMPRDIIAVLDPMTLGILAFGLLALVTPTGVSFGSRLTAPTATLPIMATRLALGTAGLAVANVWILSADFSPFLYFRF